MLLPWYFILDTGGKDMETRSGQEKFPWSKSVIDDMIDAACSHKFMKKINFSEIKNSQPMQIFLKR